MLKNILLPKSEKQKENYQLDYAARKKLVFAAFLMQTISLASGGYGLTPFLQVLASELVPSEYAKYLGGSIGFGIAFAVEFLVYVLICYIVSVIPTTYLEEEEKVNRVYAKFQFYSSVALLVGLVCFSMFISRKAVKLQIESTKFHSFDYDKFSNKEAAIVGDIDKGFKSDLSSLEQKRTNRINSINASKEAKLKGIEAKLLSLNRKEQRSGQRYTTKRLSYNQDIANIREQAEQQIIDLNKKLDKEESKLRTGKESAINRTTHSIDEHKEIALSENKTIQRAKAEQKRFVSVLLMMIAMFSCLVAVLCHFWVKMSEVRSGLEVQQLPVAEDFSSKWWYELYLLITLTPARLIQNLVRKGLKKIPDLVELEETGAIIPIDAKYAPKSVRKNFSQMPGIALSQNTDNQVDTKNKTEKSDLLGELMPKTEQLNLIPNTSNLRTQNGNHSATIQMPVKRRKNGTIGANMPKSDKSAYVKKQKESVKAAYIELLSVGDKKPRIKQVAAATGMSQKTASKYLKVLRKEAAI